MKATDRRAAGRLPQTDATWEVALVDPPFEVIDVDLEGVLLVAESASGLALAIAAVPHGDDLGAPLAQALLAPVPPEEPSRPRRIRCTDPALALRVRAEVAALGVEVEVVPGPLAAVKDLEASLRRRFEPPTAPGITGSLGLWAATLRRLGRLAPWNQVSDAVLFRFRGVSALEGTVAVVVGQAGEQVGVVLHPSEQDYEVFAAQGPEPEVDQLADVEALCLYLDPAEELSVAEQEACRRLELVFEGRYPRVAALRNAGLETLDDPEQRVLLAAIEGVLGLCEADLAALEAEPRSREVRTCLGTVTVTSDPAGDLEEDPATLAEEPYLMGIFPVYFVHGDEALPALAVKQDKNLAKALARRLRGVDAIHVEPFGRADVTIHAWAGTDSLGVVAIGIGLRDRATEHLVPGRPIWLCIAGGGTKPRPLEPRHVVFAQKVDVLLDESGLP